MGRGRVIGLISGKGGVGKTSLGVNLSIALKQLGNEVTLIDADFDASNLGVYLGRYDHPVKFQDVLSGDSEPGSAIFRHPTGIKAVVSSNNIDQTEPETANFKKMIDKAAEESDYVIVDGPPGLNSTVETLIAACDEIMIVTIPTQTAGINAAQIIEKAKDMEQPVLGTVINKVEGDPEKELVSREVEMMTESHIMAEIPYDKLMKKSLFENEPLVLYEPMAEASIEINQLAASIDSSQYEKPKFAKFKRKFNSLKRSFNS